MFLKGPISEISSILTEKIKSIKKQTFIVKISQNGENNFNPIKRKKI